MKRVKKIVKWVFFSANEGKGVELPEASDLVGWHGLLGDPGEIETEVG
jgi:hypothetical protein